MARKSVLSNVVDEMRLTEKNKKKKKEQRIEKRISDFEKLFKIVLIKEESNQNYISFRGVYAGKEIRISGEKHSKFLKILIFDILNLNVVYTGKFVEEPEHYLSVIKAYSKNEKRKQSGFYKKY